MRWRYFFPPLNVVNFKTPPYVRKGILRHYDYIFDQKLGEGFVAVIINHLNCHDCTTQLYITWDTKIKDPCNQTRYGIIFN